ncbi:MAG: hypothetical protein GWP03_05175 [Proteobacteria bacterium]|nr:hypothetical protein [Pseudomonadota bacterium]
MKKVDFLKQSGIIQGFISLYPNPTNNYIKETEKKGFQTFDNYDELLQFLIELVKSDMNFFSSVFSRKKLGQIITISAKESNDISKAEKFLTLINE